MQITLVLIIEVLLILIILVYIYNLFIIFRQHEPMIITSTDELYTSFDKCNNMCRCTSRVHNFLSGSKNFNQI